MSARQIFCRFCGVGGAIRHGKDACRRTRYKCLTCNRTFTGRTNTAKSGSQFSDDEWNIAVKFFSLRGGMSGSDLAPQEYSDALARCRALCQETGTARTNPEWARSLLQRAKSFYGGDIRYFRYKKENPLLDLLDSSEAERK